MQAATRLAPWVLAAVTALATFALCAQLSAETPAPTPVALDALGLDGYSLTSLPAAAARADEGHAHGELKRWEAQPLQAGQPAFLLAAVPVHSRLDAGFEIAQLSRHPELPALEDARPDRVGRTAVVIGRAGGQRVLRTCWLPGGSAEVALDELKAAAERQRASGTRAAVLKIAGLLQVRWECLLVSIAVPEGDDAEQQLRLAWEQAYPALTRQLALLHLQADKSSLGMLE